ncbi:MAG: hypothetical protein QOE82_156 [Thermoanaerobaculia bacterium]|jgi:hypothetical protein|nr:hypothetical protein [Thermoanaerobaculia bacterium]
MQRVVAAVILTLAFAMPLRAQRPAVSTPKAPERVLIGVWVTQIYDLDPSGGSFTATFWVWTRHSPSGIHPLDTLHITSAKKVESEPTLTLVRGGEEWDQKFFRAVIRHSWDLREYPFDEHNLRINFEESLYDGTSVVYVPDKSQSGVDREALGSRWAIDAFHFETSLEKAATTYGDPTITEARSYWASGTVTVFAERQTSGIFVKLLIGAYVAVLLAFLSYRIKTDQPTLFSARLGLLVGSLFATVVNLRSTEAVLGRTDDFTLVDKIHISIALYILVAAIFALISRRLCDREQTAKSLKIDFIALLVTGALFISINVIMISDAVM